jgi:hypothetical protein
MERTWLLSRSCGVEGYWAREGRLYQEVVVFERTGSFWRSTDPQTVGQEREWDGDRSGGSGRLISQEEVVEDQEAASSYSMGEVEEWEGRKEREGE